MRERSAAGIRMGAVRRQPPGARVGGVARLQDDRRAGTARPQFLARVFQKLLLNFTWWVNRKDVEGRHLFAGGFLGLDNIGAFNRSEPLPGHRLEQADGTAWMAFYCATMLSIAIELAGDDPVRRTWPPSFRALRGDCRRDERAGRHRTLGRGRWVLLRPVVDRRAGDADADPFDGRSAATVRSRSAGAGRNRSTARLQEAARGS